jgi:predicted MPP superfamily phosphohydrolase
MRIRAGIVGFIAVFQSILLITHLLLFETWAFSSAGNHAVSAPWLRFTLAVLSVSFLAASLIAFRYTNTILRVFYRVSAVWLGLMSFLSFAAVLSWVIFGAVRLAGMDVNFHRMVEVLYGTAALVGCYGVINAGWTRVRQITIQLENVPVAWHGRKAALISDLHLGHVRNGRFLRRTVTKVMKAKPDIVFIAGDLFDGTAIDARKAAEPLREMRAPHGVYFVAGNHEQFGDDSKYLQAIASVGVRVLHNEKVEREGLQVVGVPYNHATHNEHLRSVLQQIGVDRNRASILLVHAPDRPHIAEEAGLSLQLSGHTHLGQFYPWTWMAKRIYRQFAYGLSRIGKMQVYTSSGVGTWGPPLRFGSNPEIVLLQFE